MKTKIISALAVIASSLVIFSAPISDAQAYTVCRWVGGHYYRGMWIAGHRNCYQTGYRGYRGYRYGYGYNCVWVPGHYYRGVWIAGHRNCG